MEFTFNVNNLLAETITKLDSSVNPARRNADGLDQSGLRSHLLAVIDKMGDASAKAQGLRAVITTGRKLQLSDHILYVMKDSAGNGGKGAVVGILKIGKKRLFVYNHQGAVQELEPLCVLDFYVHESRQRMGCGRRLFDFMLQDSGVKAQHLAIDKPSFKFSQFLNKHYNLRAEIPQVNNFVVFEGFFENRHDTYGRKRAMMGRPPVNPNRYREQLTDDLQQRQNSYAGYNRTPLPPSNLGLGTSSRPGSGTSIKSHSAHINSQREMTDLPRNGQLRPISANNQQEKEQRTLSAQALKSQGNKIYSRHLNSESPVTGAQVTRPDSNLSRDSSANRNQNAKVIDPPFVPRRDPRDPPLLPRDVPIDAREPIPLKRVATTAADDYVHNLNLHQDYQGRRGQMRVNYGTPFRGPLYLKEEQGKPALTWQPQRQQTNWTMYNGEPGYLTFAQKNYTHTRLW